MFFDQLPLGKNQRLPEMMIGNALTTSLRQVLLQERQTQLKCAYSTTHLSIFK